MFMARQILLDEFSFSLFRWQCEKKTISEDQLPSLLLLLISSRSGPAGLRSGRSRGSSRTEANVKSGWQRNGLGLSSPEIQTVAASSASLPPKMSVSSLSPTMMQSCGRTPRVSQAYKRNDSDPDETSSDKMSQQCDVIGTVHIFCTTFPTSNSKLIYSYNL